MQRAPVFFVESVDRGAIVQQHFRRAFVTIEGGVVKCSSTRAIGYVNVVEDRDEKLEAFDGVGGGAHVNGSLPVFVASIGIRLETE